MNKRVSVSVNIDKEGLEILQALESIDGNDDKKRNCADKIRVAIKAYIVSRMRDKNKVDARLKKWKSESDARLRDLKIIP